MTNNTFAIDSSQIIDKLNSFDKIENSLINDNLTDSTTEHFDASNATISEKPSSNFTNKSSNHHDYSNNSNQYSLTNQIQQSSLNNQLEYSIITQTVTDYNNEQSITEQSRRSESNDQFLSNLNKTPSIETSQFHDSIASDSDEDADLYANLDDAESLAAAARALTQPVPQPGQHPLVIVSSGPNPFGHSQSIPIPTIQHQAQQRQFARKALLAVGNKASNIITNTAQSSAVMRFGLSTVSTVSKLVPGSVQKFGVNQWTNFGDPLLTRIDDKIDSAVQAIEEATSGLQRTRISDDLPNNSTMTNGALMTTSRTISHTSNHSPIDSVDYQIMQTPPPNMSSVYWEKLKSKFVASVWFRRVDEILLTNSASVFHLFNDKMLRPAEIFYNTVTEEYTRHSSVDEFLIALKQRVGSAWDDRLTPLARGFYTTAAAVSTLVGAGRFVSGAVALGKAKVYSAIDDLLTQWDRVLGLADQTVDRWLPERPQVHLLNCRNITSRLSDRSIIRSDGRKDDQQMSDESDFYDSEESTSEHSADPDSIFKFEMEKPSQHHIELQMNDSNAVHSSPFQSIRREVPIHKQNASISPQIGYSQSPCASPDTLLSVSDTSLSSGKSSKKRSNQHLKQYDEIKTDSECYTTDEDGTYEAKSFKPSFAHSNETGRVLVRKFGKRLKQRIPHEFQTIPSMSMMSNNITTWTTELKDQLAETAWFNKVDEILLQNALVKALASIVQPSQHFFNTALQLVQSNKLFQQSVQLSSSSSEIEGRPRTDSATSCVTRHSDVVVDNAVLSSFITNLKNALGASWDERLIQPAKSFLQTAIRMQTKQKKQNGNDNHSAEQLVQELQSN